MEVKTKREKASVTVEASIAITAFLFFFASFLYLFTVMNLQLRIQNALEETADLQLAYASVRGVDAGHKLSFIECSLDSAFVQSHVISTVGERVLDQSLIKGGSGGLRFTDSRFMEDGESILLTVHYTVEIPFLAAIKLNLSQNARRRVWCGFDSSVFTGERNMEDPDDPIVYITPTGSKYHLTATCQHINIKAHSISYDILKNMRTSGGGIYYPCSRCKPMAAGTVYITDNGSRYHASDKCSAIERNCSAVHLSEVAGRTQCKTCGKKQ